MSTGALLTALVAAGCAGGEAGTTTAGGRVLAADPKIVQISPYAAGSASFTLTSGGVPIAGQQVTFTIVDLPSVEGDDAKGATLTDTTATTDVNGVATVGMQVEDPTVFNVRAMVDSAKDADVAIVVAAEAGSVEVAPFFALNSSAAARTLNIAVRLFDARLCADVNLADPPTPRRLDVRYLPPSGGTTRFDVVSTAQSNAVVAGAYDGHGVAVAVGCIDLLGSSLLPRGLVQLGLPLRDVVPSPVGRFQVTSPLVFDPPLAAAAAVAAPWRDLSDCPLDPAQLLLDCIADALSPETADDPLDCRPNLAPGGEGPLGDALMARRGAWLVDAAGNVTGCRGARDATDAPSLDAITLGLFGTPAPPLLVALPAVAHDAEHVLDGVTLVSTLDVESTGRPDEYVVTHTLDGARFKSSAADMVEVTLSALVLPALTAYTTAATRDGLLIVGQHGFSLRLGQVARAGFGIATLAPWVPEQAQHDVGGLIAEIVNLAHHKTADGDDLTACAAFDAVLCGAVGDKVACLEKACPDGLGALTARLNRVFEAADGTGLDFYLSGSAPLLDMHGGGFAHQLGANLDDPTALARWWVDLRTQSGTTRLSTSFVGVRD